MFWNLHPTRQLRTKPSFFKPILEELETRRLLTIAGPVAAAGILHPALANSTAPTPPSQFQAVVSLYLDGAYLQTSHLLNEFMSSPADFDSSSAMANDTAAAAAAGINLNAVLSLNDFLGNTQTDLDAAKNSLYNYRSEWLIQDLQFNLQYAGVAAPYAVMAGAQGVLQAVHQ